jgi:alpha-beta hydrolase superfamily lysophospholipase
MENKYLQLFYTQAKRMISLLVTYLLVLLAVFLLQRKMIYYPERYTAAQQAEAAAQLDIRPWPSAGDFRGLISNTPLSAAKGTFVVFHGNAGSALGRTFYIAALQPLGYRVILAEYPGYGARPGAPSEQSFVADGIATARLAWEQFKGPLYLCGESLGSGVVAGIVAAQQVPVKGLLLISPFDALDRVAQYHYWFFFAKWLIRDKFDNIEKLRRYTGNVAVILAGEDEVIPNEATLALFDSLAARKKLWRFEQASHNTLPVEPWLPWWQEAIQFISE